MKEPSDYKDLQRPKLTRTRIVEVALNLAQKQGLESLSMRKVAKILNVEAMSLYKHIENKDDLIDGIIELIIQKIYLPSPQTHWKQALRERAVSERTVLSEHAWIVHLLESRSGTGDLRLTQQNHMIGILRRAGFSVELAFKTMICITGYVYGFVAFAKAWNPQSKERSKTLKKAQKAINPKSYPYIIEAVLYAKNRSNKKENQSLEDFDFGLNLILDGIEKIMIR